ncbi:HlyD family type I secretion periplasmic adaptor subunit [Shewanella oneidensis MR-1]|uniref:Membrane fusion protein (MFP) family protein n=1 Tax=Shewanella oneidensis (strain ATCC 700550 / JCM 31522 / CIP 106686 / LMG 19005 / NCIMB 14063 / MR-1) TaxID=211586 RepID=Q8E9W4_SHEON|nr:HlyD family type I secretion periplasmic adaptor subunit [Shewanella oneidensis]AAN57121.1 type I protein secretion system MFP component HlyD family [Shewanella oneidensis MR-1]MDX5998553.1 HlyD family type I secretion periplasmic adaptor subunit [Shewanella oneidensis]MEE2028399.1 Hemolysin secretion protein D, chromosomal [Shewanella oneidensis]QKG98394.1 HlyD family type I secretion periplasmic adaptor subunit [Shewanella oneidensis MR-1]
MNDRQLNHRSLPEHEFTQAIEAPAEKRIIKQITYFIAGSVFIMFVWSLFTNIEEIAKAKGQVIPLGHQQVIQSFSGGTLASILVSEGDLVKKGDVLANFIAIDSQAAAEELESKQANLVLKIERYSAFIESREANFASYLESHPNLVKGHISDLERMNNEKQAIIQSSLAEIAKSKAELASLDQEIPPLKHQITSAQQTINMMESIKESQAVSKLTMLESQQKLDSYIRELKSMEGKQQVLARDIENLQRQLEQKQATLLKEVGEARTDAQAELLGITARLKSSDSQVQQNTITSPVDGIIQSIPNTSSGSVIQPGGTVAVIVPTTPTALLEAKLSPRDIGFVSVGQKARIKIDAFDYSRYGALDGIVKRISPSTDADEKGGVFYKVQISIDKPYFGDQPDKLELIPGMTGEADIVTGDKTVFQYLWKPVFTNVTEAFGER